MAKTSKYGRTRAEREWALVLLTAGLVAAAQPARADNPSLPPCPAVGPVRLLADQQGALESIAFDHQGRLLLTDIPGSRMLRLAQPNGVPATLAQGLSYPGGIAVVDPRTAYVGIGNNPVNGIFPSLGGAGIAKVDLDTGAVTPTVNKGLSMANGLVRASDGTFYASDDLARSLDRVLPDGTVERSWIKLNSNGLALSLDEKTLYVNQMLPAKILAVDRASGAVQVLAQAPEGRTWSFLDGLAIDGAGRLYVAAYLSGEVWRFDPQDGRLCLLADGLNLPSAVAVGNASGAFSASSVYVTTHTGRLHEIPDAVPPGTPASK